MPVEPAPDYRTPDIWLPPPPAPPAPVPRQPLPAPRPPGPLQPNLSLLADGQVPARPLSGGTLLIWRGGNVAVASDPERDRIFVADLAGASLLREIALEPGSEPGRLAQDGSGRIFVALRSGGQLVTLAPDSFALAERRPVCPAPRGVAVLPDGSRVYVACAGGELVALPPEGPALWTRKLEPDLRDVVVAADGASLLVSTFRSARVLVTNLEGERTGEMSPPPSLNLTRRVRSGPEGPAATRFTPSVAWRTLPAPGGGAIVLHQRGFTGQIPVDPNQPGTSGGYGGQGCDGVVQSTVSLVGAPGRRLPSSQIASAVLMIDAALSRDGQVLALVSPADAQAPNVGSLVVLGPVGTLTAGDDSGCVAQGFVSPNPTEAPWGSEERGFVRSRRLRGEIVAVAFDGEDDVVIQSRQPAELRVPRRDVRISLSSTSVVQVGQAIFHANTGAGIACASCHPEGGEDARVWRFIELGPRRTQSLRGGLSQTAPLHWDGDMRDLTQIAQEVFTNRMGGPTLTAAQSDALTGWIDAIPLLPTSPPADPDAVARGKLVFESGQTGCIACHNGPRLTNNLTADVGTGRPLQVPSLLGLGARAPYLHDGCAPTLSARFGAGCGGGDRHGVTSTLTAQQIADLQTFLESL
jgi:mono/diheme cytochrome c family protein